jgi:hypothetical protein
MRLAVKGFFGQFRVMLSQAPNKKANAITRFRTPIIVLVAVLVIASAAVVSLHFFGGTTPAQSQPTPTPTVYPSPTAEPTFTPAASPTLPPSSPLMVTSTSNPTASGIEWNQTYDVVIQGGLSGIGSVSQTKDGGYLLSGGVSSLISSINGPFIIKTDSAGYILSTESFVNSGVTAVTSTSDGGYLLVEGSWLIKTDSSGGIQWNKTVTQGTVLSIIQSSDGGYTLLSFGSNGTLFYLTKTDSTGNVQWSDEYSSTQYGGVKSVIETSDGGYALLGSSAYNTTLVKTDSSGKVLWNQTYAGQQTGSALPPTAVANSIVQTSDGGYALAGYANDNGLMPWLVKTDSNGVVLWNQTYSEFGGGLIRDLIQTSDGGFAFAGDVGSGLPEGILVKTDSSGNVQWSVANGPSAIAFSVIQTADGGYVFAGTYTSSASSTSSWVIKTTPR